MNFGIRQTSRLLADASVDEHRFEAHPLTADESPDEIAQLIRKEWDLGLEPIPNLVATIEDAGAVVLIRDLDTRDLDAVSAWPRGGRPLFLVNAAATADRARFSLAHELGTERVAVPQPDCRNVHVGI